EMVKVFKRCLAGKWGLPPASEDLAILNETEVFSQLVVKRTRRRIALVREPVDAARARRTRLLFHCLDQGAAEAELARMLGNKQVLQIAIVARGPARAMEEIVRDAGKLAIDVRAKQMHRFVRVVEPRPGHVVGLRRHRRLVELDIAGPQPLPVGALAEAYRTNVDLGHQMRFAIRMSGLPGPSASGITPTTV